MHSYLNGKLPGSFDGLWLPNKYKFPATANLRCANDLYIPKHRLDFTARLPLHSFPKLWNEFDDKLLLKNPSTKSFNESLKAYFLDDLASVVQCGRAFCRDCSPE